VLDTGKEETEAGSGGMDQLELVGGVGKGGSEVVKTGGDVGGAADGCTQDDEAVCVRACVCVCMICRLDCITSY
jgi:hypothetical protein